MSVDESDAEEAPDADIDVNALAEAVGNLELY